MYNEGEFNLTKFVSNSKEVQHSIPETCRKNGVRDKDLGCKLPDEQVFGIMWNVKADTLGFKITIKENPLTRRGMLSTLISIYDPLGLAFASEWQWCMPPYFQSFLIHHLDEFLVFI